MKTLQPLLRGHNLLIFKSGFFEGRKLYMSGLRFEDILINAGIDESGRVTGYAEFPYFHKQIEAACDEGVTAYYTAQAIRWLAQVDEALVSEICQYALYYLQDELESASKGELPGQDIQHIQEPLEVPRYMKFDSLDIKIPKEPKIPVLNLSGGCDWQEDEGLHCLKKMAEWSAWVPGMMRMCGMSAC